MLTVPRLAPDLESAGEIPLAQVAIDDDRLRGGHHVQGCDFFGYAWGTPPSFLPTAMYDEELKVVKAAFAEIEKLDAERARNVR